MVELGIRLLRLSAKVLNLLKTAIGTLANLAELAEKAETPALIVVGEVVKLHEQLAWFGEEKQRQNNRTLP